MKKYLEILGSRLFVMPYAMISSVLVETFFWVIGFLSLTQAVLAFILSMMLVFVFVLVMCFREWQSS